MTARGERVRERRSAERVGVGPHAHGVLMATALLLGVLLAAQTPPRRPDVPYIASDPAVIDMMFRLANVRSADVVYDLGSGDGRIVIEAAKRFGARGVGIDIDPMRIAEANANAKAAGVSDRVRFVLGDIFDDNVHISDATVVTLYLLPSLNERLRPKLWRELKPGTRVVSNSFSMGDDWPPAKVEPVGTFFVYFWTMPAKSPR